MLGTVFGTFTLLSEFTLDETCEGGVLTSIVHKRKQGVGEFSPKAVQLE